MIGAKAGGCFEIFNKAFIQRSVLRDSELRNFM